MFVQLAIDKDLAIFDPLGQKKRRPSSDSNMLTVFTNAFPRYIQGDTIWICLAAHTAQLSITSPTATSTK